MHYQQQKLFKGVKQQVMHFFPNATLNINTVHYPWFSTQVILTGVDLKIPYQGEDKKTIYQYYKIGRLAFDVHQQDNNMSMTANKVNIRWDEKDISIDNLRFANLLVNHQFIQKVQTNINDIDWS